MRKIGTAILLLTFLAGCAGESRELERGMALRSRLQQAASCSFDAEITADYGDETASFSMACTGDGAGNLTFTVTAPETIAGITGQIDEAGGKLTFDGNALSFPLLADGQLSPISGPWLMLKALLGGYLTSAGTEGESLRLTVNDSFADDALEVDIWLSAEDLPTLAEISCDGRRILSLTVKNFVIV